MIMDKWICPKDVEKAKMLYPKVVFVYNFYLRIYEEIYYFTEEA